MKIQPSKNHVILIDKLSKWIFKQGRGNKGFKIFKLPVTVTLTPADIPLTQFDKAVLQSAISEFEQGNKFTTPAILYRALGGYKNPTDERKKSIMASLEKLSRIRAVIDFSAVNAKYHYTNKNTFGGFILPCEFVTATINGQTTESIHFLGQSVLMEVAKWQWQFINCDADLLKVPSLNNSDLVLKIKSYLLERVAMIKGSQKQRKAHLTGKDENGKFIFKRAKKLSKIILLDTLFTQCNLSDATKRQQQQARETISKVLNHFKACRFISEWRYIKDGNAFSKIEIDFE